MNLATGIIWQGLCVLCALKGGQNQINRYLCDDNCALVLIALITQARQNVQFAPSLNEKKRAKRGESGREGVARYSKKISL
jgi:hypothetical protein